MPFERRIAMILAALAAAWIAACGPAPTAAAPGKRVIVLGLDGMDHELTRKLMAKGVMPNFSRLEREGMFSPLGTSVPPQSPVAWSNFITGMDAGGHGIFDFIHRDPKTMLPYLSTSRTESSDDAIKIGKYQFPLSGGKVELLRRGVPFWEVLEKAGVRTTIIRMPANFPPSGSAHRELSGMGTPDLVGSYGIFHFFTTAPEPWDGREISGGRIVPVAKIKNVVEGTLQGPDNPFLVEKTKLTIDFKAFVDPVEPAAVLAVGDEEIVLKEGEWSGWVPLEFEMIPTQVLHAEVRFYLKRVRPDFMLYVSPLNFDPMHPDMPISTPPSFATDLARATGRYYTQGMPEEEKGLDEGVLTRAEFLEHARIAGKEVLDQFPYVLEQFTEGLLFYYVGNTDLISHMMWRPMDPGHPAYDPVEDPRFATAVEDVYLQMDGLVGYTLEHMGEGTTLIVMSDHGFTSWRRSFQLNAWLAENGYLGVKNKYLRKDPGLFLNVDWGRTRAYGLGLNGLYINMMGREKNGIVPPAERGALIKEIADKLLAAVDPQTGDPGVTKVYVRETVYKDRGESFSEGPDMIVGYARMTRGSDDSALGTISGDIFSDNTGQWSGDHCMDHEAVPGIFLTNKRLSLPVTDLKSLSPAILAEFGLSGFPPRAGGEGTGSR